MASPAVGVSAEGTPSTARTSCASLDSVAPRFAVKTHLATLFASAAADTPSTDDSEDGEGPTLLPIALPPKRPA